jgi:uncharacterized coiled-coil DUF342 family protein
VNSIEFFLNQLLKPYESIIVLNPLLKKKIESIIMKYQFEFDTEKTRDQIEFELINYITDFIIENRNNKIDQII